MPEKMKICPNCNNKLSRKDWEFYEIIDETWFSVVEKWSCECPHCKKILWLTLPYDLNENGIDIDVEGD